MESLLKFTTFLKDRQYALEDLDRFAELIEPILHEGRSGYRLKPLGQADRVTQRCRTLVHYTWHCQDYVKKLLAEAGVLDAGRVVNRYIERSPEIQVISYLANENKQGGIDPGKQRWALDVTPQFGRPFVIGLMPSFPHSLKPTVILCGDSFGELEFTGRAGIGDEVFEFNRFEWLYSCNIEDKDGRPIGNAWGFCEVAFQTWLRVLTDHGIELSKLPHAES
jgi:hypothetical protein